MSKKAKGADTKNGARPAKPKEQDKNAIPKDGIDQAKGGKMRYLIISDGKQEAYFKKLVLESGVNGNEFHYVNPNEMFKESPCIPYKIEQYDRIVVFENMKIAEKLRTEWEILTPICFLSEKTRDELADSEGYKKENKKESKKKLQTIDTGFLKLPCKFDDN